MLRWQLKSAHNRYILWLKLIACSFAGHLLVVGMLFFGYRDGVSTHKFTMHSNTINTHVAVVLVPTAQTVSHPNRLNAHASPLPSKTTATHNKKSVTQLAIAQPIPKKIVPVKKAPVKPTPKTAAKNPVKKTEPVKAIPPKAIEKPKPKTPEPAKTEPKKVAPAKQEPAKALTQPKVVEEKEPERVAELKQPFDPAVAKPVLRSFNEVGSFGGHGKPQAQSGKEFVENVQASHKQIDTKNISIDSEVTTVEVTYHQAREFYQQEALRKELSRHWKPPHGIPDSCSCEITTYVGNNGVVTDSVITQSSGILMYDISARTAVCAMELPRWTWGTSFAITFKP